MIGSLWKSTGLAAIALMTASACATAPAREDASWRLVLQSAKRFAVFVNDPGPPRAGDVVSFKLTYVYMPGEVQHEGKDVDWQQYHAVTVNCAENTVKLGPRSRIAPDGSVIAQDDAQEFVAINWGTALDDAARGKCRGDYWAGNVTFADGDDWMDAARKYIAANDPALRPPSS